MVYDGLETYLTPPIRSAERRKSDVVLLDPTCVEESETVGEENGSLPAIPLAIAQRCPRQARDCETGDPRQHLV